MSFRIERNKTALVMACLLMAVLATSVSMAKPKAAPVEQVQVAREVSGTM